MLVLATLSFARKADQKLLTCLVCDKRVVQKPANLLDESDDSVKEDFRDTITSIIEIHLPFVAGSGALLYSLGNGKETITFVASNNSL